MTKNGKANDGMPNVWLMRKTLQRECGTPASKSENFLVNRKLVWLSFGKSGRHKKTSSTKLSDCSRCTKDQ